MPRALRLLAIVAALVLAAFWLAPALLLPSLAARLGDALGVKLALEDVRPALPFGLSIGRAEVTRDGREMEFTDLRVRLRSDGARIQAQVGDGTLLLLLDGLGARSGFLRAQAVPVERLDGWLPRALGLRGPLDGVYRFGAREAVEATIGQGAVILRAPFPIELSFNQLIVTAEREANGGWRVDFADLRGPPVSGTAHGRIAEDGQLALALEVTQLDEPARSALASAGITVGALPYAGQVRGTLSLPLFIPARR
ncbi:MAG: hypothetical protein ACRDMZ_07420 [Solirubrobacteraceae bacterium]